MPLASRKVEIKEPKKGALAEWQLATRAFAAVLAAVLPEVIRQSPERVVVRGEVAERSFFSRVDHASIEEPLEMMTQRRGGEIHMCLDGPRGHALAARLHDEPENRQPDGMTKRSELLGVML